MNEPAQQPAFLWAYRISKDGRSTPLTQVDLPCECHEGDYFWLHMQSDALDSETLLEHANMPASVTDGLVALETRPRAMPMHDGVLIYLRGINKNPDANPDDMVSLRVWLKGNTIVTARRQNRSLVSVQDVRRLVDDDAAPDSAEELLIAVIRNLADIIHDTVDEMDDALVDFETDSALDKKDRQTLATLRRQAASIRRFLTPQRDALDVLFRLQGLLTQEQAYDLREQTDRITRYIEDLDLARERAIVLQDELRNQIADQQGIRMYVLSMVTAIFLPLSFLTGVFGMNVAGLPGTESPDAFTLLMGSMAGLAIIMLIAMVWKRWL